MAHQGRRALLVVFEVLFCILALSLFIGDLVLMSAGHKLLIAEERQGSTRATATIEDDRVTMILMVVYIRLGMLAIGSFIIARLMRSSRKRRAQVQALCAAVGRL